MHDFHMFALSGMYRSYQICAQKLPGMCTGVRQEFEQEI